jgi:hypothetical protein
MCATPRPKRKNVLGAIPGHISAHAALADAMSGIPSVVGALPAVQAKKDWAKIAGAPKPVANAVAALPAAVGKKAGTVDGAPALVAKALKECSPATKDITAPAKVVRRAKSTFVQYLSRRLTSLAPTNEESAWLTEEKNHIGKKIVSCMSACDVTHVVSLVTNNLKHKSL